jgi:hypothetical protein
MSFDKKTLQFPAINEKGKKMPRKTGRSLKFYFDYLPNFS